MPRRPRQHQLEDESRVAFRKLLPKGWVFRDTVPDYGVDAEVEVFDAEGRGTGQLFKVQLKATDNPSLESALVVRLRVETCKYYRSLSIPILIVRYHSPSGRVFAKWFHTFDPYYGKRGKETIAFRLSMSDEWTEQTPEGILSNLEALRELRAPQLKLPLRLAVVTSAPIIHGRPAGEIKSAVREAASKLPGVITFESTPREHLRLAIRIENDKTEATLGGAASFTLHTSKGYPPERVMSNFPSDVLLSVALALEAAGHSNVAARIVSEYGPGSSIIGEPIIAITLARGMARALRVTEALGLAEALFATDRTRMAAQLLTMPAYVNSGSLSAGEREFFVRFMQRRIEHSEEIGERSLVAMSCYNLGNYVRGTNLRYAFSLYRKATEYDPSYKERKYFWRELGGILFECGRYHHASRYYERAIELGEEETCRALFADALLFAGEYRRAEEEFEKYLASCRTPEPEWSLKHWALKQMRVLLGVDQQTRYSEFSMAYVDPSSSPQEARSRMSEALRSDALCGLAWLNLAVSEAQLMDEEAALFGFTMAGLVMRTDVDAWCNAMALAIKLKQVDILGGIIAVAYDINGEGFVKQWIKFLESQPEGFPVAEWVNLMNEIVGQLPKKRGHLEFRMLAGGANYHVTPIGRPGSEEGSDHDE